MAHDHRICSWRRAYLFDNFLRRLLHRPGKLLGPYVRPGMAVLDAGCGMGIFSIGMARLVGSKGRVVSADVQPEMLRVLRDRAERAGVGDRIETRLVAENGLGLDGPFDFALAMWMVHEVPDRKALFEDFRRCIRPGGLLLVAEPPLHVSRAHFEESVRIAEGCGFRRVPPPRVLGSRAALFEAPQKSAREGAGV
jgi:ubiquinone/menaquinone biosynthesis C-methylase UbiE